MSKKTHLVNLVTRKIGVEDHEEVVSGVRMRVAMTLTRSFVVHGPSTPMCSLTLLLRPERKLQSCYMIHTCATCKT